MFTAHRTLAVALATAAAILTCASRAAAQTQPSAPDASDPSVSTWRFATGYLTFALRDVARTGSPVDASPLAWQGRGLTVEVQYTRERVSRLHRVDVAVEYAGDFTYRSTLQSVDRPADDQYGTVEGVYEYRRYPFRNVLLRGLDVGIGVQGLAARSGLSRHVPQDIVATETTFGIGTTVVAAARWRRWAPVTGEIWWGNGGIVNRLSERHTGIDATRSHWGGGWITHFSSLVDFRVSAQTRLTFRYFRGDDGLLSSHRSAALSRSSIAAGVTYAR